MDDFVRWNTVEKPAGETIQPNAIHVLGCPYGPSITKLCNRYCAMREVREDYPPSYVHRRTASRLAIAFDR